jgi:hypothetical protein
MEFINNIIEARALRTPSALGKMSPDEIATNVFLHILVLQAIKFNGNAEKYAKKTFQYQNFTGIKAASTDLHNWISVILNPNKYSDSVGSMGNITINEQLMKRYLRDMSKGKIDIHFDRRFLLQLEKSLKIKVGGYKAIRRIVAEWANASEQERKLAMTRLLQAIRANAPTSDLRAGFESISRGNNWEIDDAKNAEGKGGSGLSWAAAIGGGYLAGKGIAKVINKLGP